MKRSARRRSGARALRALAALALAFAAASTLHLLVLYPRSAGPGAGATVLLEVPRGAGAAGVARAAAEAGVARGPRRFALYLRLSGAAGGLQAGRHRVRDDWSPAELARALGRPGLGDEVRVTHREGRTRFDLAGELDRLGVVSREAFLEATADRDLLDRLGLEGETAEGYLFPETYRMEPGSSPAAVVERLVATFRARVDPVLEHHAEAVAALERDLAALDRELAARRAAVGPSEPPRPVSGRHGAVVLASIVEAETHHRDERPLVAAVFLNRLRSPAFPFRRLQSDPTVSYGCVAEPELAPSCRSFSGLLATSHLQDRANRYSTYARAGLPPGPIGNPSTSSIEAVLAPAVSPALYFVARPDGRHEFSETLEAHNEAVARLRAARGW